MSFRSTPSHDMYLMVVGACYIDTILTVPHYPTEDEKLRATEFHQRCGGNGPNTLQVLRQLVQEPHEAFKLALCAVLPETSSAAVRYVQQSLGESVDLLCIHRPDFTEAASSYIIRSDSTGSRTIVNHNPLPEMTLKEFTDVVTGIPRCDIWYHFEGRIPDITLDCIKYIRSHQPAAKVSVEIEKPGREGLEALAAVADVLFYSRTWAQHRGFKNASECLASQRAIATCSTLLCCTWGEEGAAAYDVENGDIVQCPASFLENSKVVDSVGAGDTFIAAMLYCMTHKDKTYSVKEMLQFAIELAGQKVGQEGFDGLVEGV